MQTKKLGLVLLVIVLVLLASTAAGWKWGSPHHKTAGWTWDDGSAQYYWVD